MRLHDDLDLTAMGAVAFQAVVIQGVAQDLGWDVILTSNKRRALRPGDRSYHRLGYAWDYDFSVDTGAMRLEVPGRDAERTIEAEAKNRLGKHYDAVWHDSHLHVEWDPEREE